MNFSISLIDEVSDEGLPVAKVVLGADEEYFPVDVTYWSADRYSRHWLDSCRSLTTDDQQTAVLITSMSDPAGTGVITCYVLFRDLERVYVQQRMIFPDRIEKPLDETSLWRQVGARATRSETGEPISEWTIDIESIRQFVSSAEASCGRAQISG